MAGEEIGRAVNWAFRTLMDDLRRRNEAAAGPGTTDTASTPHE
jgi:hypothetical protein